jgi:hypothetical protein
MAPGIHAVRDRWKAPQLLVAAEKEKQLVLDDRPADATAELVTLVRRQEGDARGHSIYKF